MEKKNKKPISQVFTTVLPRFARYGSGWAFSPFECVAAHSSGVDGGGPGVAFAEWRWLTFTGWPGLSGEGE